MFAVVCALTGVAAALRLAGIGQSLHADEFFTYRIVTWNSVWQIPRDVADTAITPPLHYLLAWLAVQAGEPTTSVRVPSVLFGAATVPLVYLLGARTVGRPAALVGAAIVAFAPFSLFYGVEARAYATLGFLSALSTLALLAALERPRPLRWAGYALCAAAILYTHYSGVFVVLAQGAWALWARKDQARALALSYAGIGLAFLPWLPAYMRQDDYGSVQAGLFESRFPLSLDTVTDMVAHVLPGYPFVDLADVPGTLALVAVWVVIGAAVFMRVARIGQAGEGRGRAVSLLVVLALATPRGLVLYSLQPDTSLLLPRNLSASLPAFALVVGGLLTSLRPPLAVVATALVLGPLLVGALQSLEAENERPQTRAVARLLDRFAGARDAIYAERGLNFPLYFDHAHALSPLGAPADWDPAAPRGEAFVVASGIRFPSFVGRSGRVPLRSVTGFPGIERLSVARYEGRVSGVLERVPGRPPTISWSLGPVARASPHGGLGAIETVSLRGGVLSITGWAIGPDRGRAGSVLAFAGDRLVLAGRPHVARVDVARAHGSESLHSGFRLEGRPSREPRAEEVQVFAVTGARAARLEPVPGAGADG